MAKSKKMPTTIDPELRSILDALPQSEGQTYTWRFRAEIPGRGGMPFIGEEIPKDDLPPEELQKHVDRIREEHPDILEIVAYLYAGGNEPVKVDGKSVRRRYPPLAERSLAHLANGTASRGPSGFRGSQDPDLAAKQQDLQREKEELRLREEKIRTDKQRARLDAMEAGGSPAAPGGVDPLWPLGRGVPFKIVQVGPNEFQPFPLEEHDLEDDGWFPRRGRGRFDRDREREPRGLSFQEQLTLQREAAAAAERLEMLRMMMAPKEDGTMKVLLAILPAITGGQTKLPELMAMVDSMRKGDQIAMKHALEQNGDIMKMVAEHALESGAPSDMIDQAKRIVEVATEGFGKVVKHTTGRESLLNPDKPKGLPAPPAAPKAVAPASARKPQAPPPAIEVGAAPRPLPPPAQSAIEDAPSPEDVAKAEGARRCIRLLSLHEREMRIESDPAIFFEDEADAKQIVEFVLGLPKAVRAAIEKGDPKEIYDAFRVYVPAEIDALFGLMADPAKGKDYTSWAADFWEEVRTELSGDEEEEPEPEHPQRVAE